MTATAIKGDRHMGEQKTRKRESWWRRKNNVRITQFNRAIDGLQELGYVTEVWVDRKSETITLRWAKKGNQWHVTSKEIGSIRTAIANLANNALMWIAAVDSDQGHESNYAVREV